MVTAYTDKSRIDIQAILEDADCPMSTTEIIDEYWRRKQKSEVTDRIVDPICVYSILMRMCDAELVVRSPYRQAAQNFGVKPIIAPPNGTMSTYWGLSNKIPEWRSHTDPSILLTEKEAERGTRPGYSLEPARDVHASRVPPLVTDVGWHIVGKVDGKSLWQWQECQNIRVATADHDILRILGAALNYIEKLDFDAAHVFIIEHLFDGRSGMPGDYDLTDVAI